MEQGLITFFDVKACGFYRKKDNSPVHVEGSLSETIKMIHDWVQGREFDQTLPWDKDTHVNRSKVYCKSSCINENDAVFVFWKQFGNDSGNLNGILAKSKVDDKGKDTHTVETNIGGQKVIYGQPMYYWYIPEHDLIASIKFPHSLSDSEGVCHYIKKCIDLRIEHPRKRQTERSVFNPALKKEVKTKSISYRSENGSYSLYFKIDAALKELSVEDTSLENLAKRITHIVVRESISSSREIEKNSLFSMYDRIRRVKSNSITRSKQVEIVSEESVDAQYLESILKTYSSEYDAKSTWENVGFRVGGINSSTKWFDNYVDRKRIVIDQSYKKDGKYYLAETLIKCILSQRDSLLDFANDSLNAKIQRDLLENDEDLRKASAEV